MSASMPTQAIRNRFHSQMLIEAAAVFVCLATVLTFQITCCSLLLLGQTRAIAGSTHPLFRLIDGLEGRQRWPIDDSATTRVLGSGNVLRKAVWHGREGAVVQCSEGRSRHRTASVHSCRAIYHRVLYRGTNCGGIGRWRERRALPPIDTMIAVHRPKRNSVRVRASVGVAYG